MKLITHVEQLQAWKSWLEGKGSNLIDPTLEAYSDSISEIERCIHIGLLCVQENIADRPTMASVVHMLNTSPLTLSMPSEPAFFLHSSIRPQKPVLHEFDSTVESNHSKTKSACLSVDDASITGCYPRWFLTMRDVIDNHCICIYFVSCSVFFLVFMTEKGRNISSINSQLFICYLFAI